MWRTDSSGHGEVAFLFIFGAPLAVFGIALLIGGAFEFFRLPGANIVRWAPLIAVAWIAYSLTRLF